MDIIKNRKKMGITLKSMNREEVSGKIKDTLKSSARYK